MHVTALRKHMIVLAIIVLLGTQLDRADGGNYATGESSVHPSGVFAYIARVEGKDPLLVGAQLSDAGPTNLFFAPVPQGSMFPVATATRCDRCRAHWRADVLCFLDIFSGVVVRSRPFARRSGVGSHAFMALHLVLPPFEKHYLPISHCRRSASASLQLFKSALT